MLSRRQQTHPGEVKFRKELSGVIHPRDQFGTHLSSNGETIDAVLELKNFAHGPCSNLD